MLRHGGRVHRTQEQGNVHHPIMEGGSVCERSYPENHASAYCDLDQFFHDRRT
jgi:hypothetical protein